jgi:hypothetical protein
MTTTVGIVALATAVSGAIAGVCAYVLYTAEWISVDTSAILIAVSVLCALAALPIGLVGRWWADRRAEEARPALGGVFVALGTLGTWLVVVIYALGR